MTQYKQLAIKKQLGNKVISERDITAARDVLDDLQWFMSYELANTYSNFDGKKFEELCKA